MENSLTNAKTAPNKLNISTLEVENIAYKSKYV